MGWVMRSRTALVTVGLSEKLVLSKETTLMERQVFRRIRSTFICTSVTQRVSKLGIFAVCGCLGYNNLWMSGNVRTV